MLKLLLDEHISPRVAAGLCRRDPEIVVRSVPEWEDGAFLGQEDSVCLQEAFVQKLTFVTYDRRTVTTLLKSWAEAGRHHAGVIFVDEKTISQGDMGTLVECLDELLREASQWDWTDLAYFLRCQVK
jgi:hypothetical protein